MRSAGRHIETAKRDESLGRLAASGTIEDASVASER